MIKPLLELVLNRRDLCMQEARDLFEALVHPQTTDAQRAGVLAALRTKGETAEELAGFAGAMVAAATDPGIARDPARPTVDIVGTGGDGACTLNVSTAAALLLAAGAEGRVRVVKHGNRAVSSACGSADVLQALGLPVPIGPAGAKELLDRTNFTFLFAPHYHAATGIMQPVRRALGVRTVFNLLGPLTNPARPDVLFIGAADLRAADLLIRACALTRESHFDTVVCTPLAEGGCLDEATACLPFRLLTMDPHEPAPHAAAAESEDFGVPGTGAPADLRGRDAAFNAEAIQRAFAGEPSAFAASAVLTAALAWERAWPGGSMRAYVGQLQETIRSGRASRLLDDLRLLGPGLARGEGRP